MVALSVILMGELSDGTAQRWLTEEDHPLQALALDRQNKPFDVSVQIRRTVRQPNVVGFMKGKSAISIARNFLGRKRNFTGESFWARGYFVSTVGLDEEVVREYIRHQEKEAESGLVGQEGPIVVQPPSCGS